jgi:hypothetical protein
MYIPRSVLRSRTRNIFLKPHRELRRNLVDILQYFPLAPFISAVCGKGRGICLIGCLHVSFSPQMQTDMLSYLEAH